MREQAAALAKAALDTVAQGVIGWGETRPARERRQGLRFVLHNDPTNTAAAAAVRALVPAGASPPEPFPALDWLDFADAAETTTVGLLDADLSEFAGAIDPIAAQGKQQLLQWRAQWRKDLQALQTSRLLLFSPVTHPGSIAKALAAGEVLCDTLEAMFAEMPKVRQEPRPMLVFLYASRDEYLAEAKKAGLDIAWTAGFYSRQELVPKSRLYVPNDAAGFARVLPTLAHELTHQWLRDRCPAFLPEPAADAADPAAFWIVEGIAAFVEQFEFDLARRTARPGRSHLAYADLVASARPEQLLPWGKLVHLTQADFARGVADKASVDVPSTMQLGANIKLRWRDAFYAQSAMLTRYLYEADDGRLRRPLLEYIAAYYTARIDQLDFAKAFGVDPDALGPKVVAHAADLLR